MTNKYKCCDTSRRNKAVAEAILNLLTTFLFSHPLITDIIGTRHGVDRVKPWNSVRINLGLDLIGPDIRPGLRHQTFKNRMSLRS